MERATSPEKQPTEGERYLQLLGLEHLADRDIPGRGLKLRDFLEICGAEARAPLAGLAKIGTEDPRFAPMQTALRTHIKQYIGDVE